MFFWGGWGWPVFDFLLGSGFPKRGNSSFFCLEHEHPSHLEKGHVLNSLMLANTHTNLVFFHDIEG